MTKAIIVLVFLIAGAIAQARIGGRLSRDTAGTKVETCMEGDWKFNRTGKASLFEGLTPGEFQQVEAFLLAQKPLNLVSTAAHNGANGKLTDNFIWSIEWDYPNKTATIAYLDANGAKPDRAAKVVVYRGSKQDVVMYRVFPVPNPKNYTQVFYKRPIQWRTRIPDGIEYSRFSELFSQFFYDAQPVVRESFAGYDYNDCTDRCLRWSDNAPRGTATQRYSWFWWLAAADAQYLHHIGLSIRIDHDGMDPSKWKVGSVVYNGYQFNSAKDLVTAYRANRVPKIKLDPNTFNNTEWSTLKPRGTRPKGDFQVPPRTYEPEGHRWFLTGKNTINYLDWRFDFSIVTTSGLHIWDARYKGDRVIYELAVKEAMSAYSGYDIAQLNAIYIDTAWGLGTSSYELIPGSDCPFNAEYFDYSYYSNGYGEIFTQKNAICIFEQDFSYPARRHFKTDYIGGYEWTTSQQGTALVVRTTSPIYNYDYVFDYIFYPNGVVESKFALGGYIQSIYYSENNYREDGYSTRVHTQAMGSIHQHIAAYKLDLDVAGTANTFQTVEFVNEKRNSPFVDYPVYSKKYVKTNYTKEVGMKSDFTKPMYWVFTNQAKKNKWGVERGYRIHTGHSTYLLGQQDPRLTHSTFAKYQIAVTKHRESEGGVNSIFCQSVPQLCPQHLDDYLDGEKAYQEDLVAWIPIGSIHLPAAEEVPSQSLYGYSHSFYVRPYNYFDEDPGMNIVSGTQFYRLDRGDWSGPPVNVAEISLKEAKDCLPNDTLDRFNGTSNI